MTLLIACTACTTLGADVPEVAEHQVTLRCANGHQFEESTCVMHHLELQMDLVGAVCRQCATDHAAGHPHVPVEIVAETALS